MLNGGPAMRNSIPIRIWVVVYLCLTIFACSDDPTRAKANDDPAQTTEAISKTIGRLEIRVDPKIELLNVVENAKSFGEKHLREPTMRQEISNYFLLYRDHPAVEMMQK
jgi:hypothetical protein